MRSVLKKPNIRNCPILEAQGVNISSRCEGLENNWKKDLCLNCELDECFNEPKRKPLCVKSVPS